MTDPCDRAEEEIEMELAEALRKRKPAGPVAIGACHYCGEYLRGVLRWCDVECEAAWEYEDSRRRQNRSGE